MQTVCAGVAVRVLPAVRPGELFRARVPALLLGRVGHEHPRRDLGRLRANVIL